MPVLVTGASGFLGGRLAQMLVERGDEVVVLARAKADLRHLDGLPVRVVRGDLADEAALLDAVTDATGIYHCAACSTDWAPDATYFSANVTGTRNLLVAARSAAKLERFLHVSTTDIYGYPELPGSEDQDFVDAGLPYNRTKILGERAVWQAAMDDGLPITIVRPATIYGPRGKDFTLEVGKMLRQRLMAVVDGGSAPGGFAYVDNVAEGMILAAHAGETLGQVYNLCDGTDATWKMYLALFAQELGTKGPWIDLSFDMAMRLAGLLETPHRVLHLGGRPLLTKHAVYLLGRNQEFPTAKARRDFGFRPAVSLEEGVRRSAEWFREVSG